MEAAGAAGEQVVSGGDVRLAKMEWTAMTRVNLRRAHRGRRETRSAVLFLVSCRVTPRREDTTSLVHDTRNLVPSRSCPREASVQPTHSSRGEKKGDAYLNRSTKVIAKPLPVRPRK